ncbi:MAG: hypothetical protein LBK69_06890 [Syntrophomonadaceae bacterium]|jgi:flagellar basal-body rod modification protein FlgD|nr:hypothetical protein [Syntrophomonadaceae bacterium]
MAVNSVNGYTNSTAGTTTLSESKELGQEDFLKLLVTQLQNQDPLNPQSDREFIAQMASFSSLEQMKNLNNSFSELSYQIGDVMIPNLMLQQSAALIGREVSYINPEPQGEDDVVLSGVVQSVVIMSGVPYCVVDGKNISMESMLSVMNQSPDSKTLEKIAAALDKITKKILPDEEEETAADLAEEDEVKVENDEQEMEISA